jgi:hypothetical protein
MNQLLEIGNTILAALGLSWPAVKLLLIWGGITGLLNFVVGRKPQIDKWCEEHPRVAGVLKLFRSIGFSPWAAIDAVRAIATGNWAAANKGKLGTLLKMLGGASIVALLLVSCSGASNSTSRAPSAQSLAQVAVAAIAVTDAALATAIDHLPPGVDLAPWEARVEQLESAAELAKDAEATTAQICNATKLVAPIAESVECEKCSKAIETISSVACGGDK